MDSIKFTYTNWHGDEHEYVVVPEPALTFGAYANRDPLSWLISGHVISRDGEPRPGRRTFRLVGMSNIKAGERG